jgi:hypothetical protein
MFTGVIADGTTIVTIALAGKDSEGTDFDTNHGPQSKVKFTTRVPPFGEAPSQEKQQAPQKDRAQPGDAGGRTHHKKIERRHPKS